MLYLAPGGDCNGAAPCYGSPQAAVDAAQPGSVIRIAAGTYPPPAGASQVLSISKSLFLQGGFRITDWYEPQPFTFPSVLDGQNLQRVILIAGNPADPLAVSLEGLQITKGAANQGAGLAGTGVELTVKRCVVNHNAASGSGGGIFLTAA